MEQVVKKVCVVDVNDAKVLDLVRVHYECEVVSRENVIECDQSDKVVYLIADFESEDFKRHVDLSLPIISPVIVLNRHRQNLPLPCPRPRRPLYCETLCRLNIILRASDEAMQIKLCAIVRYMGGHVKREPNANTNFLVTEQARGKAFRQCASLGQKVVLPSWLFECWQHRDDADFDPVSEEIVTKHRLGVFEKLKVFVHDFCATEEDDIKKHILDNNGLIVDEISDATHCVINTSSKDIEPLLHSEHQKLVTNEWVWASINIQYCANEESYHPGPPFPQNFLTGPSLSTATTSEPSCVFEGVTSIVEAGTSDKGQKVSKAFQVSMEIYETEVSYLNAIKLLVAVKEELDLLMDEGVTLLQKSEISLIFGKLPAIAVVHEGIIGKLKVILENWRTEGDVAQVWIDAFEELNRVYAPYSNTHDTAMEALGAADKGNPRVHAFLRAKECSKEFKRNTFKDLLIRPVQRIPTLIVLLKELEKRADKKTDKIKEAIMLMDKVVSRANEVRAQNDNFIEQFNFFNEVEGVPPHIVCSRRKMVASVEAYSICGTMDWQVLNKRRVKVILYNDLIMVCKVRNAGEKPGTLRSLTRRASFSTMTAEQRKQFKYFNHLLIPHVREVNRLKLLHYEGEVDDRLEPDMLPIYSWTIRDISSDACWYIEAVNKENMIRFVDEIHKKIFMEFGREVTWHGFVVNDLACGSIKDTLIKHIRKSLPKDEVLFELPVVDKPSALSTLRRRSASGLRRTVSHVGNITRRSIPSAFRSTRNVVNDVDGEASASTSVQPLTSSRNTAALEIRPYDRSTIGKDTVGSALTMVEESEQELYTAVEYSSEES